MRFASATRARRRAAGATHFASAVGAILVITAGCDAAQVEPRTAGAGSDRAEPPHGASGGRAPTRVATAGLARARAADRGGLAGALEGRGVPRMIWGHGERPIEAETPADAARRALERFAPVLGAGEDELRGAHLAFVREPWPGTYVARFQQRLSGVEVMPARVTVLLRIGGGAGPATYELVLLSGGLQPVAFDAYAREGGSASAVGRAGGPPFTRSPREIVAALLADTFGLEVSEAELAGAGEDAAGFIRFALRPGAALHLSQPARAKRIYFADEGVLVAAHLVELMAGPRGGTSSEALRFIVADRDLRVLERRDLRADADFEYRVWAEPAGALRPLDGPLEDASPHPTGLPDGLSPAPIPQVTVTLEGFNRFGDPWLDAQALETSGNNADAYTDDIPPDGYSNGDLRAIVTGPRSFAHVYDPALDPAVSDAQVMAAVIQLFYTVNWLHDDWYEAGFDEIAGNAQRNNHQRGGAGGDPLLVEALDSYGAGRRNNANMSTPSDGMSPRMQVYAWTGRRSSLLEAPPGTTRPVGAATFGPRNYAVTAPLVRVETSTTGATDACTPLTGAGASGAIALVDRGSCTFVTKALNVQAGGAVGLIIADDEPGVRPPGMGGAGPGVSIPVLSVTQADGDALKSALVSGPVTGVMAGESSPDRNGALDNTLVAHEWGHYLHHRLQDCGSSQCGAMSEGWADFLGLHLVLREGDDLDGAFAAAPYAAASDEQAAYFGIRRFPYSVDPAKNALTFRHVADGEPMPGVPMSPSSAPNSEVHNAGEVWASMLHEAYVALLREHASRPGGATFEEVRRTMARYVVTGLQLTPIDATFTETRDGLLAAALAHDATDHLVLAEAFAARGAGTCASSPERYSSDFVGVVEDFGLAPRLSVGTPVLRDDAVTCDGDGLLDAAERGHLRVVVGNGGPVPLSGAVLTLTSTVPGVLLPLGRSVALPQLAPFAEVVAELDVELPSSFAGQRTLELAVRVIGPGDCAGVVTSTAVVRVNADELLGSTEDRVEAAGTSWTEDGDPSPGVWSRLEIAPLQHVWHGRAGASYSDAVLESPPLEVGWVEPFVFSFDHRYSFEGAPGGTYWDGGVLELSQDGGVTWDDFSLWLDPGYGGVITGTGGNPLASRPAFVGTSTSWPLPSRVSYDFGATFAGTEVRVRFRLGTDGAVGDHGWEVDNLRAGGLSSAPFLSVVDDSGDCELPIVAEAGEDRTVEPGALVVLDGSESLARDGAPLAYAWSQLSGPEVELVAAGDSAVAFVAPGSGAQGVSLVFRLEVSSGPITASDTVSVHVSAGPEPSVSAHAGVDQRVRSGAPVLLDGSGSRSSAGLPLAYSWAQRVGPPVELAGADRAVAFFAAPEVREETLLRFNLAVSDGTRMAGDTTGVIIEPAVGSTVAADAGVDHTAMAAPLVVLGVAEGPRDGGGTPPPEVTLPPADDGCSCAAARGPGRPRWPWGQGVGIAWLAWVLRRSWARRGSAGRASGTGSGCRGTVDPGPSDSPRGSRGSPSRSVGAGRPS